METVFITCGRTGLGFEAASQLAADVAELWALAEIYGKPLSFFAPDR